VYLLTREQRVMAAKAAELASAAAIYQRLLPKLISRVTVNHSYLSFRVSNKSHLTDLATILKHSSLFRVNMLQEVTAVDKLAPEDRFLVYYAMRAVFFNRVFLLEASLPEESPIDSMTGLYKSAIWAERECYDMFGIIFKNNPDLRRILTDYGFAGHPLRKDFPVMGYREVRYDDRTKSLINEPIELAQIKSYLESIH
jgi:NADH dehydrogenase (ubiquinone) Fe-S protein 3